MHATYERVDLHGNGCGSPDARSSRLRRAPILRTGSALHGTIQLRRIDRWCSQALGVRTSLTGPMSSIYLARQPIFELGKGLYGYELLYRRDDSIQRADGDQAHMSAEVIASSLLGIGLRTITGSRVAFVNFSRAQLIGRSWELFQPGEVVIELLENIECCPETLLACQELVRAGYRLALDDYVPDERTWPLLELASIVKIDVLNRSTEDLDAVARTLRPLDVRLLAERVETSAVRDRCADMGYELFQGYLFSRPETLTKTDVSAGQLAVMKLLTLLQDPSTPDMVLAEAFQSDVALCYKLLRMVNAASLGGRGITSIQHAVRIVGREMLHRWLAVFLVASLGCKGDVTQEIALIAITRARMCELVSAASITKPHAASAFIVGLLSLLDVLLEVPMDRILSRLQLSADVCGALIARGGPLGVPLRLVEAYERADWATASGMAQRTAVVDETLPGMYLEALHWATERLAA